MNTNETSSTIELMQPLQNIDLNSNQYSSVQVAEKKKTVVKGGRIYAVFKRMFDVVCSLIAIIVLAIPMLIVGILIKCTSKGPMIYVSKRVGKNGKVFNFYKFRTMRLGAEYELNRLLDMNEVEGGVTFKMEDDPRITGLGRFLRRFSIDELPQLFNILKGEMSIVGPRPCTVREFELYSEKEKERLSVPQGLTGEWQVNGRSDTTFEEMINFDMDYIQNKRSFWYDLKLIFKTIGAVLTGRGAK